MEELDTHYTNHKLTVKARFVMIVRFEWIGAWLIVMYTVIFCGESHHDPVCATGSLDQTQAIGYHCYSFDTLRILNLFSISSYNL